MGEARRKKLIKAKEQQMIDLLEMKKPEVINTHFSNKPPAAINGAIWFNTINCETYIYYDDPVNASCVRISSS